MSALRQQLVALAAAAGVMSVGTQQSYYDYGISMIGEFTGYSLQPYEIEVAKTAVRSAEGELLRGDADGALEARSSGGPQVAVHFEPSLAAARRRVSADAALDELVS